MASSSAPARPTAPVVVPSANNIIVNPTQRLNPVLEHVRNVGKEFGDIVADYQVGRTTGVVYLSLKYHRLHPEYIHQRIERLRDSYNLRILLLLCDVTEHQDSIRELTKTCLINNITVIVAWSTEEAGHYIATFKQFEHRPPDMIRERVDKDHSSVLRNALTSISKVNKTDVETLRSTFGSFARIATASSDRLSALPGFGAVKVRRMKEAFDRPFRAQPPSTVPAFDSRASQATPVPSGLSASNKGKEKAVPVREASPPWDVESIDSPSTTASLPKNAAAARQPRPPSPAWDIELDLNASPSPPPPAPPPPPSAPTGKRPASPVWDLELDLNPSDEEPDGPMHGRKRRKANDDDDSGEFGTTTLSDS